MNQAPRDVEEKTGDAPRMENSSADGEARDAGCERRGRTKARAYLLGNGGLRCCRMAVAIDGGGEWRYGAKVETSIRCYAPRNEWP